MTHNMFVPIGSLAYKHKSPESESHNLCRGELTQVYTTQVNCSHTRKWNTEVNRHKSTPHVHCRHADKWKHNGDRSKECPFMHASAWKTKSRKCAWHKWLAHVFAHTYWSEQSTFSCVHFKITACSWWQKKTKYFSKQSKNNLRF